MILVKVLKRKDAASVLVAVVIAMALSNALMMASYDGASRISNWGQATGENAGYYGYPGGWRYSYLQPLVALVLQLVAFEILAWVYVFGSRFLSAGTRAVMRRK
jgi:hypothetical protein